ncbi:hypothetical protein KY321_04490 [Candidatus Woesearchaeota archaeon]|nr:hypothetical protein [Candidatus Woesearchaeota archaeon]
MSKKFGEDIRKEIKHEIERVCKRAIRNANGNVKIKTKIEGYNKEKTVTYLYKKGLFGGKDKRFKSGLVRCYYKIYGENGIPEKVSIFLEPLVDDVHEIIMRYCKKYPSMVPGKPKDIKFEHHFDHTEKGAFTK